MVMEFVRGETLEHLVERMGALSPQRAAELCMQALTALAHAHSMGVVHRDLKPANLMITEIGRGQDHGLRHRARERHGAPHERRVHDGHARLHGARAGARPRDRRARRPLRARRRLLSPDDREAAVQGRHAVCDGAVAGERSADADRACCDPTCRRGPIRSCSARSRRRRTSASSRRWNSTKRSRGASPDCRWPRPTTRQAPTELLHTPSRPMPTGHDGARDVARQSSLWIDPPDADRRSDAAARVRRGSGQPRHRLGTHGATRRTSHRRHARSRDRRDGARSRDRRHVSPDAACRGTDCAEGQPATRTR